MWLLLVASVIVFFKFDFRYAGNVETLEEIESYKMVRASVPLVHYPDIPSYPGIFPPSNDIEVMCAFDVAAAPYIGRDHYPGIDSVFDPVP